MANGSRRSTPAWPSAAAVVSDPQAEPRKTPCSQLNASFTSGIVLGRRPPNRIAESGTPSGFCRSEERRVGKERQNWRRDGGGGRKSAGGGRTVKQQHDLAPQHGAD